MTPGRFKNLEQQKTTTQQIMYCPLLRLQSNCGTLLIQHTVNFSPVKQDQGSLGQNYNVQLTMLSNLTTAQDVNFTDQVISDLGEQRITIHCCYSSEVLIHPEIFE